MCQRYLYVLRKAAIHVNGGPISASRALKLEQKKQIQQNIPSCEASPVSICQYAKGQLGSLVHDLIYFFLSWCQVSSVDCWWNFLLLVAIRIKPVFRKSLSTQRQTQLSLRDLRKWVRTPVASPSYVAPSGAASRISCTAPLRLFTSLSYFSRFDTRALPALRFPHKRGRSREWSKQSQVESMSTRHEDQACLRKRKWEDQLRWKLSANSWLYCLYLSDGHCPI